MPRQSERNLLPEAYPSDEVPRGNGNTTPLDPQGEE